MTNWYPQRDSLRRPFYVALADQIAAAIEEGLLGSNDKLPPHRDLAYDLKISIQTVSKAYDILTRRGLVSGEVGRGTYVKGKANPPPSPYIVERTADVIDLSIVMPVSSTIQLDRMKAALARLSYSLSPASALSFRSNAIFPAHNDAAVEWLGTLGVESSRQNVLITNGASSALTMALMTTPGPGGTIAAEDICYHVIRPLCDYLGIKVRQVAMDDDGMSPVALEELCTKERIGAILLQPNIANPTAIVMPQGRRSRLAEVARQYDLSIVETDVFGPLMQERPTPVAFFAPERTLFIAGFSKIAMPGLRIAYLAAPDRYAAPIANRHLAANWMATPLMAEIATLWHRDGTLAELIEYQRSELQKRHIIASRCLIGSDYTTQEHALHLWLRLPEGHDEQAFVSQARVRGVAVAPSLPFSLSGRSVGALRISLGASDEADLQTGLEVVASLLNASPDRSVLAL